MAEDESFAVEGNVQNNKREKQGWEMISPQNNLYLKVQKVKASKFLLACVPSVSVWIRSKERPKHEKQDFCAVFDTHSFIHTYIHTYSFFE